MKITVIVVVVIFSTIANASSSLRDCPKGWIQFKNKCYFFDMTKVRYNQNQKLCEKFDGNVTAIRSEEENKFIKSQLGNSSYWIGARRIGKESKAWVWYDQTSIDYTNWEKGQHEEENPYSDFYCAMMFPTSGTWYDESCMRMASQQCETAPKVNLDKLVEKVETIEKTVEKIVISEESNTLIISKLERIEKDCCPNPSNIQQRKPFIDPRAPAIPTEIMDRLAKLEKENIVLSEALNKAKEKFDSEMKHVLDILKERETTFREKVVNILKTAKGKLDRKLSDL